MSLLLMPLFTHLMTLNREQVGGQKMRTQYLIPGVVASDVSSTTTSQWLASLTVAEHESPHRLADLRGCTIVRVEHYRQKKRSIARELILLHMHSGKDTRFIRLERFKHPSEKETDMLGETSRTGHDNVKIVDSIWNAIGDDYDLVQGFAVQNHLDVIDVAALAFAITHPTRDFLSHHMCMWWAATFFAIARLLALDPPCTQGPGFTKRGMIYSIRLVDDQCRLLQPNRATLELIASRLQKSMRDDKMDPLFAENFIALLTSDFARLSDLDKDFRELTISFLRSCAKCLSEMTRHCLEGTQVKSAARKEDDGSEVWLASQEKEELRAQAIRVAEETRREAVELKREAVEVRKEAVELRREAVEFKKEAVEFKKDALGARSKAPVTHQTAAQAKAFKAEGDGAGPNHQEALKLVHSTLMSM